LINTLGAVAAIYGVIFFLAYSGGALVRARSSGALDDGAACAVLVRVATELAHEPRLEHTDVEFIFFSGEELGAEGSAGYVKARFSGRQALPTYVVNLDPVGATGHLAVAGTEARLLRSYRPDPQMIRALGTLYTELTGSALNVTSRGGLTDAVSFAAIGIPTVTLVSEVPPFVLPRGMHTAGDRRSRIDLPSLDFVQELLVRFVANTEANGMKF
jgi:Zn-dependent M28 family amino/carboxypeptidase